MATQTPGTWTTSSRSWKLRASPRRSVYPETEQRHWRTGGVWKHTIPAEDPDTLFSESEQKNRKDISHQRWNKFLKTKLFTGMLQKVFQQNKMSCLTAWVGSDPRRGSRFILLMQSRCHDRRCYSARHLRPLCTYKSVLDLKKKKKKKVYTVRLHIKNVTKWIFAELIKCLPRLLLLRCGAERRSDWRQEERSLCCWGLVHKQKKLFTADKYFKCITGYLSMNICWPLVVLFQNYIPF